MSFGANRPHERSQLDPSDRSPSSSLYSMANPATIISPLVGSKTAADQTSTAINLTNQIPGPSGISGNSGGTSGISDTSGNPGTSKTSDTPGTSGTSRSSGSSVNSSVQSRIPASNGNGQAGSEIPSQLPKESEV